MRPRDRWAHTIAPAARPQLAPILQASDVLVMNKTSLLDESTRADVCPELNPQQLHRLLTIYSPDEFDPDAVHPGVLKEMATLARNSTRPLHRKATPVRLDLRLGVAHFDLAAAASAVPAALRARPGFAFLAGVAAPLSLASAADDEPW